MIPRFPPFAVYVRETLNGAAKERAGGSKPLNRVTVHTAVR
jgi:hypothetical protein